MEPEFPIEIPPEERSLFRIFVGILLTPWRIFEDMRDTPPNRAHWLIPLLLYIAVAATGTQIIAGLPGPASHLRTLSEQDFLPRLEEYVREGTMTRQQTEWLRLFITPGTGQFFFTQLAGTTFTAAGGLFLLSFLLWQLGRSVLARAVPYKKVMEVVGLTLIVGVVERVITTALIAATGSLFATPGPGLLMLGDTESKVFLLLSSINICTFWEIAVAGTGLSRVYDRDFPKVLVLLLALWLLWTGVMLFPIVTA